MTRGKILFISPDDKVYTTTQFNGDMYVENGYGEEIIEAFNNGAFDTFENYEKFCNKFNDDNFGYDEEIVYDAAESEDSKIKGDTIDIIHNMTDYLYIISQSKTKWKLAANNGQGEFEEGDMIICNFDEFVRTVERENIAWYNLKAI